MKIEERKKPGSRFADDNSRGWETPSTANWRRDERSPNGIGVGFWAKTLYFPRLVSVLSDSRSYDAFIIYKKICFNVTLDVLLFMI